MGGGNPAKVKERSSFRASFVSPFSRCGTPPMSHVGAFDGRIDLESAGKWVARTATLARPPECSKCDLPKRAVQAREDVIVTSREC